jgi:hypothetical protein
MPTLKIEIDFDSKVTLVTEDIDGERVPLSLEKMVSFITGGLGDLYVKLLVPHEDIMMELHAKKALMMKKGAIFDMMPIGEGQLLVKVKGVFKVDAYSHVAERVKLSKGPIYVTGIYSGDWPSTGGDIVEYDQKKQISSTIGQLL